MRELNLKSLYAYIRELISQLEDNIGIVIDDEDFRMFILSTITEEIYQLYQTDDFENYGIEFFKNYNGELTSVSELYCTRDYLALYYRNNEILDKFYDAIRKVSRLSSLKTIVLEEKTMSNSIITYVNVITNYIIKEIGKLYADTIKEKYEELFY